MNVMLQTKTSHLWKVTLVINNDRETSTSVCYLGELSHLFIKPLILYSIQACNQPRSFDNIQLLSSYSSMSLPNGNYRSWWLSLTTKNHALLVCIKPKNQLNVPCDLFPVSPEQLTSLGSKKG